MANQSDSPRAFSRAALMLTVLLLAQAAVFYGFSRGELVPQHRPLDQLPVQFADWMMVKQGVIEKEIQDVLQADDYTTRWYGKKPGVVASLFVAFFKTQKTGQAPHSPKNCLPASGWIWTVSDQIPIHLLAANRTITVNRYIVQKGEQKSLVLYWYQSRDRVVASEYWAKVYVVVDALRYNRTDTALVRVEVPVIDGNDQAATRIAVDFVQAFFTTLRGFLPA
jgi:EpsI family protein